MQRYEHTQGWQIPANAACFFAWWDVCEPCHHVQLHEEAKVRIGIDTAAERYWRNHLTPPAQRPLL